MRDIIEEYHGTQRNILKDLIEEYQKIMEGYQWDIMESREIF